jgi:succinate dehydrogenase/fumarate reductase flavoprotein subunit
MPGQPQEWDRVVDVVVVGTGGGAMVAATLASDGGADVLVVEKDSVVGGTTGVSGGVMWVPQNAHMAEAGIEDNRDDALAYIDRLADGRAPDPSLIEVFVDTAPEMLAYLNAKTPLRTHIVTVMPDYYFAHPSDIPGRRGPGRSVEPLPFAVRSAVGDWADRVAVRSTLMSLGSQTTLVEDLSGTRLTDEERARREREDLRAKGAAYIGSLLKGLLDRGVEIMVETPALELVVGDGETERDVVGVRCEREGAPFVIGARQGVVLACGGFEWNNEMVRAFIGYDVTPLSPGTNTGDGHVMAMEVGAKLGNMTSYWGQGAMFDPAFTKDGEVVGQMSMGLGRSSLVVNRHGRRFFNEDVTYNDWPKAFGNFDANLPGLPNQPPAWQVFDGATRATRPILSVGVESPTPEWIPTAATIRELAAQIGVDADRLETTVARFNEQAARGVDEDFGRTAVRPLEAPFFAAQTYPATLGTNGGVRIDRDARVVAYRGGVVPGLYAVGNTSAGIFGGAYPSGGGPIAAAATFGYLAGRHVASRPRRYLVRP